jgi:hypothetical protein
MLQQQSHGATALSFTAIGPGLQGRQGPQVRTTHALGGAEGQAEGQAVAACSHPITGALPRTASHDTVHFHSPKKTLKACYSHVQCPGRYLFVGFFGFESLSAQPELTSDSQFFCLHLFVLLLQVNTTLLCPPPQVIQVFIHEFTSFAHANTLTIHIGKKPTSLWHILDPHFLSHGSEAESH